MKNTYHDDFCFTRPLFSCLVVGGRELWVFACLFCLIFFLFVFFFFLSVLFFLLFLFVFTYEVFMHCTVKSTPRVAICSPTLHPNELPSPQVTCTTGCLSTWQVELAVPNKNPWRSKQAFLLTWQKFRLNRKTYLKLFFHYLALLNHLGKR